MADSNWLLSLTTFLPTDQENEYLQRFSYFILKLYVVCSLKNCLSEAILKSNSTYNHCVQNRKDFPNLSLLFLTLRHN